MISDINSAIVHIRKAFIAMGDPRTLPLGRRTSSAVIVPLFIKNNELCILFTRRTEKVKDHKSQISFPGGVREKGDRNLLHTAIRETREEIGLDPNDVHILGRLDDISTYTGYRISPFAGFIPWPCDFQVNEEEIEELISCPLSVLLDPSLFSSEIRTHRGRKYMIYYFTVRPDTVIWGATAKILSQFLEIVTGWQVPEKG
jgi:8-oxo-dGTP pyrophosphatase MutT (NUDIX family)